jgi:hypothetical protein
MAGAVALQAPKKLPVSQADDSMQVGGASLLEILFNPLRNCPQTNPPFCRRSVLNSLEVGGALHSFTAMFLCIGAVCAV